MEIPVYLFTGFLESGKTKFIQGFLEDERIQSLEKSVQYAADVLWKLIDRNKDQQDYFKGIMVEKDLDVFC